MKYDNLWVRDINVFIYFNKLVNYTQNTKISIFNRFVIFQ